MGDYSVEVEMLSAIYDRLGQLIQAEVAISGRKPTKIEPAPRPVTAAERLRTQDRRERHRSLVARVLPHRHGPPAQTG